MSTLSKFVVLGSLVAVGTIAGCFDSLVSDPCAAGYQWQRRTCVAKTGPDAGGPDTRVPDGGAPDGPIADAGPDAGGHDAPPDGPRADGGSPDAGPIVDGGSPDAPKPGDGGSPDAGPIADGGSPDAGPTPDAGPIGDGGSPDAQVCTLTAAEMDSDPNNCGRCDHVCSSGLCVAGLCVGDPVGHVVAIGHDYQSYHLGMARVLGNAIALGRSATVRVGWWRGDAAVGTDASVHAAASLGLLAAGRASTSTTLATFPNDATLANLDVVVVEPQPGTTDATALDALGAANAAALHAYLVGGGVIVVLEGAKSINYRFAHGAGLYDVPAPTDVTALSAFVVKATDAVAQQVPIPYIAETTSVGFDTTDPVVETLAGNVIVFHRAVQ